MTTWTEAEDGCPITDELLEQFVTVGLGSFSEWLRLPAAIREGLYRAALERELRLEISRIVNLASVLGGEDARSRAMQLYATIDGGRAQRHAELEARAAKTAQEIGTGRRVL